MGLRVTLTTSLLLVWSGSLNTLGAEPCADALRRALTLSKGEQFARLLRELRPTPCASRPSGLMLGGWAHLKLAYLYQARQDAALAEQHTKQGRALLERYLQGLQVMPDEEDLAWAQETLRRILALSQLQRAFQEQRRDDAVHLLEEAGKTMRGSQTRTEPALGVLLAQAYLARAAARGPRGLVSVAQASAVRMDAERAQEACAALQRASTPYQLQLKPLCEEALLEAAQRVHEVQVRAQQQWRQRLLALRIGGVVMTVAGVALVSVGAALWSQDGHRSCAQAPYCPTELDTGGAGRVMVGVGAGVTSLGVIGVSVGFGLSVPEGARR